MDWREYVLELSDDQIKAVSEICRDIGQVCLASGVVPFIFPTFIPERTTSVFTALILAVIFWSISIKFLNRLSYE